MCSITIMLGGTKTLKTYNKHKPLASFLQQALYTSALRGVDGTGYIAVSKGTAETYKKGIPSDAFIHEPKFLKVLKDIESQEVIIAHTRAGTRGNASTSNAHPFSWYREDGSGLHGVHNGTLRYWANLSHSNQCVVDSDALFGELSEYDTKDVLKRLEGAFALAWWDDSTKKVYVVRNDERPLTMAWVKGTDSVLMTSEGLMLEWIADRNGIEIETKEIEEGVLYTFDPYDKTKTLKESLVTEEVEFYTPPKREPYVYTPSTVNNLRNRFVINSTVFLKTIAFLPYQRQDSLPYLDHQGIISGSTVAKVDYKCYNSNRKEFESLGGKNLIATVRGHSISNGLEHLILEDVRENVTTPIKSYLGPDGTYISLKDWKEATKAGCWCCQKLPSPKVHKDLIWYTSVQGSSDFTCPECATEYELNYGAL